MIFALKLIAITSGIIASIVAIIWGVKFAKLQNKVTRNYFNGLRNMNELKNKKG